MKVEGWWEILRACLTLGREMSCPLLGQLFSCWIVARGEKRHGERPQLLIIVYARRTISITVARWLSGAVRLPVPILNPAQPLRLYSHS